MLDMDRVSKGWQAWLTPRQTRIIHNALSRYEADVGENEHVDKLVEWFGHETEIFMSRLTEDK